MKIQWQVTAKLPFPLLHIDTGWKFREMIAFRDQVEARSDLKLLVHINAEGALATYLTVALGSALHTHVMKTEGLRQALEKGHFDAAFGGARRDEEKSRAKERIFSLQSAAHGWDPRNQRPEFKALFNTRLRQGETMRVFPLSNWTDWTCGTASTPSRLSSCRFILPNLAWSWSAMVR